MHVILLAMVTILLGKADLVIWLESHSVGGASSDEYSADQRLRKRSEINDICLSE